MSYSYEQISFVGFLLLPLVMMSLSLLFQTFVFILDWVDDWETRHVNMFHVLVGRAFGMRLRDQWWRKEHRWETENSFEDFSVVWWNAMLMAPTIIGILLGPLAFLAMGWEYFWYLSLVPVFLFILRWRRRRWKSRIAEAAETIERMKRKGGAK